MSTIAKNAVETNKKVIQVFSRTQNDVAWILMGEVNKYGLMNGVLKRRLPLYNRKYFTMGQDYIEITNTALYGNAPRWVEEKLYKLFMGIEGLTMYNYKGDKIIPYSQYRTDQFFK